MRGVLENKSVFDQAVKMLNKCGFEIPLTSPKVLVVKLDAQASLPDQTYQNYAVVYPKELVRTTQADYVCCISSGNQYSTHYLQDLLNGFKYVDVDFVTQSATIGKTVKFQEKFLITQMKIVLLTKVW